MITTLYSGARGCGKTTWLANQAKEAIRQGMTIAILVPATNFEQPFGFPENTYTEARFERARGSRYDHVYVDNADLFEEDPLELCKWITPGADVTMTYTPSQRSTLRILATPPDSPVSEPTLSSRDQEFLALLLAARTGESLRRITESGIVTSAVAAGLLWKLMDEPLR